MGANIKITSDSKKFQEEMKQITQDLKLMSSELSVATTKAELFGSKQEQLTSKSKELNNTIKGQNTILGLQKQAVQTLTGDIEKYRTRNTELSKSIAQVESKLKESIKNTGENSKETKELQQELSKLQKEYNSNEKAIASSSKQVDSYKIKMNETEKSILETKKALEETDKKLSTMKWDKAQAGLDKFGKKATEVGKNMTTKVTLPIVATGVASVKMASDMEENINKTDTVFKKNSDEVKKWSDTTLDKFGIANVTALDMASTFGDMGTSMGIPLDEATKMSTSLVGLSGDLASFKNIKIDVAKTALNGIYTGETESLKQLGVIMTQTNLDAYAMANGFGKTTKEMNEAEKVNLRYAFVMDKLSNANGDFEKTGGGVANQARVTKESIKQLGAEFGQNLLPIVASILKPLNEFLKKLGNMSPTTQKVVIGIAGFIAIIGPLLLIVGKMAFAISSIIGLFSKLSIGAGVTGAAVGGMSIPILPIILVIGALVAIGVLLWKNWDWIKEKAGQLGAWIGEKWNGIKEATSKTWNNIKEKTSQTWGAIHSKIEEHGGGIKGIIGTTMEGAKKGWELGFNAMDKATGGKLSDMKDKVSRGLNAVKDFFANLRLPEIKIPHIKMPHIGVTGEFSIKPPRIPKFSVDWYSEGAIFTSPTILGGIGVGDSNKGFGSNAEAILPLNKLWGELAKNFDKHMNNRQSINVIVNVDNNMDSKAIGKVVTTEVKKEINRETNNYRRSKGGLNLA